MGNVYAKRGEYDHALDAYTRAITEHRAIGFREGIAGCLNGSARALLELADSNKLMPEFLPRYLPDVNQATWRAQSLRSARKHAEESMEMSKPDILFSGLVLLARIDAVEDRRDAAVQALHDLLQEAVDDEQSAEVRYWLWKMGDDEQAATALVLYESLFAKMPKYLYKQRLDELKAFGETS